MGASLGVEAVAYWLWGGAVLSLWCHTWLRGAMCRPQLPGTNLDPTQEFRLHHRHPQSHYALCGRNMHLWAISSVHANGPDPALVQVIMQSPDPALVQVIMQSGHGRSADIWSVGCTVIEMISGKPPFSEFPTQVSVLFHIANTQDPPAMPPNISDECRDFLLQTFQRNPRDRPTAATLLQHPFVMRGLDSPVPNWEEPKEEKKSAGTPGGRASPEPRQTPPPQTDAPTPKSRAAESINDTLTTIDLPPAMVGTPSGASGSAGGTRAGRHVQGFGEAARVVKEHRGDKIADEQVVKDYLYQQVCVNACKGVKDYLYQQVCVNACKGCVVKD